MTGGRAHFEEGDERLDDGFGSFRYQGLNLREAISRVC